MSKGQQEQKKRVDKHKHETYRKIGLLYVMIIGICQCVYAQNKVKLHKERSTEEVWSLPE